MRILIKGTNWIGDAVMSIPAIRLIRRAFPDAFIALHTRKWAEGIFADSDLFDEIISYEPGSSRMRTVIEQSRALRAMSFDAAVLLPNSFESAVTIKLAGVPRRFGYRTDGRRILLSDSLPVPEWKSKRHESEFYGNLAGFTIRELGRDVPEISNSQLIAVSESRMETARDRIKALGSGANGPIIAIGAGSTNSMAKRWSAEYFARLCDLLSEVVGSGIVLLGSPNEADAGSKLTQLSKAAIFDLTGKTNLAEATAILSVVDLFVSNDMGLAHIAAGAGTPTLTLFGPTNEVATAPLGTNARFMREVVECSPCMLRECPIDHRCMTRLTPERVFETAKEMLQNLPSINDATQR